MSKQQILVVDDEPKLVRLLWEVLTATGFEVVATGSGREAIAKAAIEAVKKLDFVPVIWPTSWGSAPISIFAKALNLTGKFAHGGLGLGNHNHQANEYMQVKSQLNAEKYYVTFLYEYAKN